MKLTVKLRIRQKLQIAAKAELVQIANVSSQTNSPTTLISTTENPSNSQQSTKQISQLLLALLVFKQMWKKLDELFQENVEHEIGLKAKEFILFSKILHSV
jgi:hypothetical protein